MYKQLRIFTSSLMLLATTTMFAQTPIYDYQLDGNGYEAGGGPSILWQMGSGNAAFVADRNGNAQGAIELAGQVTGYVDLPNIPVGSAERTISFWYKCNDLTLDNFIFFYGATATLEAFAFKDNGSNHPQLPNKQVFFSWASDLQVDDQATTNWIHIACVYTGTQMRLYRDGLLIAVNPITIATSNANTNFYIGTMGGMIGINNGFTLDELRIYDVALTAEQVALQYDPTNPNPVYLDSPEISDVSIALTGSANAIAEYTIHPHGAYTTHQSLLGTNPGSLNQTFSANGINQGDFNGQTDSTFTSDYYSLTANTTYYYRISATNTYGNTESPLMQFTTGNYPHAAALAFVLDTFVTQTTADIQFIISPGGACNSSILYGTDMSVTQMQTGPSWNSGDMPVDATVQLTNLTPGTLYYYLVKANNTDLGSFTFSNYGTFTTLESGVSVDEIQQSADVYAYPNPTNNLTAIHANQFEKVDVMSPNGQLLFRSFQPVIDLGQWENGVYFLIISTLDGTKHVTRVQKN